MAPSPRPTLERYLDERVGLEVCAFAQACKIPAPTLRRWWRDNRLALKLLVSGFEKEVKGNE